MDPTKHRHPGPRTINRRSDRIGGFGNNRRIGRKTLFNAEDSTIESEVLRGHRAEGGGRRQRRSHLHVSSQEWSLIHIFARIIFIDFAVQCPLDIQTLDKAAALPIAAATRVTDLRQYINSNLAYSNLKFLVLCTN